MPINGDPNIERDPPEGDMRRNVYDTDESDTVDDSDTLEGSTRTEVQNHVPRTHTHSVLFSISVPIDLPASTGTDKGTFHFAPAFAGTITEVYLMAKTAPGAGKTLTVDVNLNGTTIFTTQASRPSIAGTDTEDTSDAPDVDTFAKNDEFTIDVDVSTAATSVADAILLIRGVQTTS